MLKSILSLLVCAALVIPFAACRKNENIDNSVEINTEKKLEGETFNMYIALATAKSSYVAPEETGDPIVDAIFLRNNLVEEELANELKPRRIGFYKTSIVEKGTKNESYSLLAEKRLFSGNGPVAAAGTHSGHAEFRFLHSSGRPPLVCLGCDSAGHSGERHLRHQEQPALHL